MNYQFLINITFRTLLAMFIGGLIGWERESTHRPAGLRTHMLVAVGSCAIMQLGSFNATHIGAEFNVDPSRLGRGLFRTCRWIRSLRHLHYWICSGYLNAHCFRTCFHVHSLRKISPLFD